MSPNEHTPGSTGDLLRSVLPGEFYVASWDEALAGGADERSAIDSLFPAEARLSETYAERRRAEFAAVRTCARAALSRAGFAPAAILKGARGVPIFPPGAVGTLTHTEGLRAAAVAHDAHVRGVGVDAEPHGALPDGVLGAVSLPAERQWVTAILAAEPELRVDKLLFSAKEATYKAWFPLTRRWLGFEDAEIRFSVEELGTDHVGLTATGGFTSRILVEPGVVDGGAPLEELRGRWVIAAGFVVAAIALPHAGVHGEPGTGAAAGCD